MKPKKTYLNGQSVFIVSLLVVGVTLLTVYLTGINYNRSINTNLYLSLGIIGISLLLFLTYGLYKGVEIIDNFPKFRGYTTGDYIPTAGEIPDMDMPTVSSDDGFSGLIVSILLWIVMSVLFFLLLIILEAVFWVSIFIILAMLYWIFFRALRLVFSKATETEGDIGISAIYAFAYTVLYLGWIFGIVYLAEVWR